MSRETTEMRGTGSPGGEVGIPPPGYRLPAATRLGPVRLRVADQARSQAFHGRMLGLVPRDVGVGRTAIGTPEGDQPLIEIIEVPGVAPVEPRSRIGLFHFALRVPERAALASLFLHLREMDVRLGTADHSVSEALYLTDPDGLGIDVYVDRPRSRWRSRGRQVVMTTEPLDVDDLIAEAGGWAFDGLPRQTAVGHVHLHVGMNTWAGEAPSTGPDDAGLMSWTLLVPEEEDAEQLTRSLEDAGVNVRKEGPHGGVVALDPWGTAVELIADSNLGF